MHLYSLFFSLLTAGLLLLPKMICAQTPLVDPQIPDGEVTTYYSKIGDNQFTVETRVQIKKEGNQEFYEITSLSKRQDKIIQLDKKTMAIISVHTLRKYPDATLDSHLRVLSDKQTFKDGELKLADFNVLMYIMRGFPFGKLNSLKIGYYGEGNEKSYTMMLSYKGIEKVTIKGKAYECHKFRHEQLHGDLLTQTELVVQCVSPPLPSKI